MVLALAPVHGATLQQEYLDIYIKLSDSERLERSGDFRGALEGFEDCYNRLNKIHRNNPDWEHVLVSSRMEDCKAKIAYLEPKVGGTDAPNPAPAIVPNNGNQTVAPVISDDAAALKMRLQDVESQLLATKAQLADVTAKFKNSQLQVQALHTQIDAVNQQLNALKSSQSVDQNMGQLMAQNKTLTDKLASAQAEIKTLAGSPNSKAGRLAAQLKAVQDKLDATQAANQGLTETTNTLQSQLNQAQNDLALANQKLAAAGPGSPEYLTLKRENEVMRSILTHEIQEQSRRDGAKRIAQEEFDRLKINSKVLQEQLDILGSPMAPPSNDEERSLLASLKAGNGGVMPLGTDNGGNQLVASTNGAPVQEGTPPTAIPPPAPASTNVPGIAAATNASSPVTSATNSPPAMTNAAPSVTTVETNVAPSTNAAPAVTAATNAAPAPSTNATPNPSMAADTNAPPATNTPPPPSAAVPTNTAPAVAVDTNAVPTTNVPPIAADTNAPLVAASTNVASTDSNPPAAATNATPDNATAGTDSHTPDPTRYSYKPRLPDDMREVAQEATDLFKMQRYDEAATKYQLIIDKYPESLYAWSNLGVVRSQEGKFQEAQRALQQAVKLSPNDAFSYRNLGIVYYQLNQYDAAIDALERSIALDPNNVYSHDYLGCATSQKGWQVVAEHEFLKAIEINDDFPDAHYNLAIIYATQKPPALELARRHYKRALELGLPKDLRLEKLLGL